MTRLLEWWRGHSYLLVTAAVVAAVVVGLAYATHTAYSRVVLALRGEPATATCTGVEVETTGVGPERRTMTTYSLRFTTTDGTLVESRLDSKLLQLSVNGTLEVLYDPHQPTRVCPNTPLGVWGYPAVFGGCLLVGTVGIVRAARSRRLDRQLNR